MNKGKQQKNQILGVGGLQREDQSATIPPDSFPLKPTQGSAPYSSNENLISYNYGRGALDTHLIAQGFFRRCTNQSDRIVAYIGVNDLLTQEHPLTRREREEAMKKWRNGLGSIQQWTSKSRLLADLDFYFVLPTDHRGRPQCTHRRCRSISSPWSKSSTANRRSFW